MIMSRDGVKARSVKAKAKAKAMTIEAKTKAKDLSFKVSRCLEVKAMASRTPSLIMS